MSTDGPRVGFFFKGQSGGALSGDADRDGHQYALTPSAVGREPGSFAGLRKPCFKSPDVPGLNGGKHEPHALGRS